MTNSNNAHDRVPTRVPATEQQLRLSILSVLDLARARSLVEEMRVVGEVDPPWPCSGKGIP